MVRELLDERLYEATTDSGERDWSDTLYEEIDGVRVELPPMSARANKVKNALNRRLIEYLLQHDIGESACESLFALGRWHCRPDVAFVPYARWPKDRLVDDSNAWDVVPALVAEVVSPTDKFEETIAKALRYVAAGVSVVWLILPVVRRAVVATDPNRLGWIDEGGRLDGGDVLPGLSIPLGDVLPPATNS